MARFAVCIPVYNGAAFVGQALESIASQSHGDLEVIVSDNASSDGTPEILASWSDRLPMRIIRREQTLPMRDHFNALLDEVDSDAYMLLCHDDYLASPEALAKAQSILDARSDISAVYCDLLYVNEYRRPLAANRSELAATASVFRLPSGGMRSATCVTTSVSSTPWTLIFPGRSLDAVPPIISLNR